tara:strand:- start:524 stop:1459 length:936 start_codon:yes stop_codon:yes gene_type:complete
MSKDRTVKAVSIEGVSQIKKQLIERKKGDVGGIDHTHITEPHGNLLVKGQEKVIEGQNNNFIIMGRDRPGDGRDGYGGAGHTHASTIRLIAGLHGRDVKESNIKKEGKKVIEERLFLQPSPSKDAATFYMSQKTDIDSAFNISTGGRYGAPQGRSAILAKADCIRLVGRESLKLVTKTENKNSLKGPIRGRPGIELIAGNDTTNMQPLVKGKNLIEALDQTMEVVNQLSNIVEYLAIAVQAGATGMIPSPTPAGLVGIAAFPGKALAASVGITYSTLAMSYLATFKGNLEIQKLKNKYSEDKLVSRHNMTN